MNKNNYHRLYAIILLIGSASPALSSTDIGNQSLNSYFSSLKQNPGQSLPQTSSTEQPLDQLKWVVDLVEAEVRGKIESELEIKLDPLTLNHQSLLQQMDPQKMRVDDFVFLTQGGRFKCALHSTSESTPHILTLSGRIIIYKEIPVLIRPIGAGETISENDITFKAVPENQIHGGVIETKEDLIGTQPKSGRILSDKPIRPHQVTHEMALRKGAIVTISYKNANMVLQAKGRSMDNGKLGSTVRVTNIDSNQTLEATVTGSNDVTIENMLEPIIEERP
ncbi:MAG: flagellar basal body P-ring formation chaperone FlgA [Alphaproteobacteria bacterium]|nr:flagellar basal body P-ring formation chaperone FlgA [Alphaproteobacteria bacterium]